MGKVPNLSKPPVNHLQNEASNRTFPARSNEIIPVKSQAHSTCSINMHIFLLLLVPMVYSCFLSFVLIISFLQVQVGGKELGTGKADSSGICRSPTSPASTLARPTLQASPPRLGAPIIAGQLLPAPARGLAVRPGSRHAPRLPEAALGPCFKGWRGIGSQPR